MAAAKTSKKTSEKENYPDANFHWSDGDVQLLLDIIRNYKAYQATTNMNWAKNRARYEKIDRRIQEAYPTLGKGEFRNKREEIAKDRATGRIKNPSSIQENSCFKEKKWGWAHN